MEARIVEKAYNVELSDGALQRLKCYLPEGIENGPVILYKGTGY